LDRTVGHQYFSMCWITSSVPWSCETNGRFFGLYIESVRSRTKMHLMPQRVICLIAKERLHTHMLVCTPRISRVSMLRILRLPSTSWPWSVLGSSVPISMASCCRFQARYDLLGFSSSQPPSESSIGSGGSSILRLGGGPSFGTFCVALRCG